MTESPKWEVGAGLESGTPVFPGHSEKVYFHWGNTPHEWQLPSRNVQPGRQAIIRIGYYKQISFIYAMDSFWYTPLHAWNELLTFDIFQSFLTGHKEMTEAVITVHSKAILFFGYHVCVWLTHPEADFVYSVISIAFTLQARQMVIINAQLITLYAAKGYAQLTTAYKKQMKVTKKKSPLWLPVLPCGQLMNKSLHLAEMKKQLNCKGSIIYQSLPKTKTKMKWSSHSLILCMWHYLYWRLVKQK